jgi:DNA polymerase III alpha subunit
VNELVPLPVRSHYSLGLGTAAPHELVQHAGQLGYRCLALADVENLYGQVQFHAACRAHGLQAITGVELRGPSMLLGAPAAARPRVVVLARNAHGYSRLCRVVTARRTSAAAVVFSPEVAMDLASGAFLLTDDVWTLRELARAVGPRPLRALLSRPSGRRSTEPELLAVARELGVAAVAGLDAAMLRDGDRELAALVRAVHEKSSGRETDGPPCGALVPPARLATSFTDAPEALREARALADECQLDLLGLARAAPDSRDAARDLLAAITARRDARFAAPSERATEYSERLTAELTVIAELGLCEPFTSLAALVADARQRGVPIAARGSAVSSLIGHLLGLSPIDPVAHALFFERFASSARRTPPDIDLDVASRHRDDVIERFIAARGPERTARLVSFQTYRQRSAYRLGLQALGAPRALIESFMRQLPADELLDAGHPVPDHLLAAPWRARLQTITRLIGTPRHAAMHPGGILLGRAPLLDSVPLERLRSGAQVSQFDAESLARFGVMKVDLLGSHCLDEMASTLAALEPDGPLDGPGRIQTTSDIPMHDEATLARIDRAATLGCFQLESPLMRSVLARLPIRSLADIAHALAIVRPGPAAGQAKEMFIERARRAELERRHGAGGARATPRIQAPLAPIAVRLAETHGLLIYEEDILFVLAGVTGMSIEAAEALRVTLQARADDEGWLARARQRFVASGHARGFDAAEAERLWSSVVQFARYSFNKAHATSQALLAYQSAFLATHAPLEHGCALLDHHAGAYPRRVIAADLARRGAPLLPPRVERSRLECVVEADTRDPTRRSIRVGLGLLSSLGSATRQRLLDERARCPFEDADALTRRVRPRPGELAALLRTGACDELLGLLPSDYPWVQEAVLERLVSGGGVPLEAVIERARHGAPSAPLASIERERSLRRIQNELRYLRMHLSDHPMRVLREDADRLGCVPSDRLERCANQRVPFAGLVAATRRVALAEQAATQYVTLEDEHGLVEAQIAPRAFARLGPALRTPGPYLLEALVAERQGSIYLVVQSLMPFHERPRR